MKTYTESELQELKKIRNYFGEHDKTSFEHSAFAFLDKLINSATEEVGIKEDDYVPSDNATMKPNCDAPLTVQNNIEHEAEWYANMEISKEKNPEHHALVKRIFVDGWTRASINFREHGWLPPSEAIDFVDWALSEDCPYIVIGSGNHTHITDGHEVDTEALLKIFKNQTK